ncbi:MAG: NADH-quinone oxidoreductase subunit C [Desulfomicrobium sp.]|nr:NADH-quinone oxidoreductase subunit C [Pseudomonadota bacterium]MBV1712866.1 NADH-quinone oxidoreductase subunit C [Desulfomicrobium sp.]MBU4571836.1 NADH-quinone oxidoreductase subunit C [Pseudomonadota bacterium]MBU4595985.1 NADH-quinone oxidoreductase subunit C [Pseudomonadota bacterium]MBV1721289.1 NADH-quinone oxidoreductase subunit C [Desulfomicrobium sp.]
MAFETKNVEKNQLAAEVQALKNGGQRLLTMTCVDLGESFDLLYHFDLDLQMTHLRLTVPKGESVPSISGIYFAALVIENETQDLFGIKFEGLALDFGGHFYLEEEVKKYPFCKVTVGKTEKAGEGA